MPYTVQQLIKDSDSITPIGIGREDSVQSALNLMIKHQFSQLPVIDKDKRLIGEDQYAYMVTNDSIIRSLNNLNVTPSVLRVFDTMIKVRAHRLEDDLFDLLKDLRDVFAVPIMNNDRTLVGIVTSYDTTEYFRKRAEDMMHVEEIEKTLKEYINAYFRNEAGEIDHEARNTAIEDIMSSNRKELNGRFQKAVAYYLELLGDNQVKLKQDLLLQAFEKYLYLKAPAKPFDQLTLDDYIRLFVHNDRWERYKRIFPLDSQNIKKLLEGVRDSRNDVAHFRIETITDEQRDKIQFCQEWLKRFYPALMEEFKLSGPESETPQTTKVVDIINQSDAFESVAAESIPVAEVVAPDDSRYAPLAILLKELSSKYERVSLTFKHIEEVIHDELPQSARQYTLWWSNDPISQPHSQQWLDEGWRVSRVDLDGERVVFTRIKERGKAYIDFFNALLVDLNQKAQFHLRRPSPNGQSWVVIAGIPEGGPIVAFLAFSFARYERFRIELYIDRGDKERNKLIFDSLCNFRGEIEPTLNKTLQEELQWERIDDKRASRIALYHRGAITDSDEELADLRTWAVDAMIQFQQVMERYVNKVMSVII